MPIDAALHRLRVVIERTTNKRSIWLHGVRLAERLFGNAQAMNTMLLGLAWQRGLEIPVDEPAILRSIPSRRRRDQNQSAGTCGTHADRQAGTDRARS